jgi:hypothetical protein
VESAELEATLERGGWLRSGIAEVFPQPTHSSMRSWLLIETLLVLLVANAIVWFAVAMGWP